MSLKRNTIYNLAGSLVPMFVGMVTVPIYLHKIGNARYGVLAIVWLFLGYFGLFDPGITRAAIFHIARLHPAEKSKDRESVFWTALLLNLGFGLLGGLIVYLAGRPIFMSTFKMPEEMRAEVMQSLPWLAASVPVSIGMGVLGGALQARERFGAFNTISVGSSLFTQLVPLAVACWWGPDLRLLIPAVLLARTASAVPMGIVLTRVLPLGVGGRFDRSRVKPLFSYGGWITLTNFLNPVLTSMDRMLIGSVLNATAVAFYSVPFNLVTRLSIVPGALSTSLFPRLSKSNHEQSSQLASDAVLGLAAIMTPLIVIGIACLPIFMKFWVGAEFARHSAGVGIVLLIGMWANGLAFIPFEHLQATERPDLVAKFHAAELVPFLGVLWVGLHYFGLMGAAWAWTARVVVDAILLFWFAGKTGGWQKALPGGLLVLVASCFPVTTIVSARSLIQLCLIAAALAWSWRSSSMLRKIVRDLFLVKIAPHRFRKSTGDLASSADFPTKVSIAMATYNGAAFLREQLHSLAEQILPPFELVVTDDGSNDGTLQILDEFAQTASFPVRIYTNPARLGYADNFLRAASLCSGDLIAFCDQDDVWLPNKLSTCVREFSDPELLLCAHSGDVFGENAPPNTRVPDFKRTRSYRPLGFYPLISCYGFAMVFRKSLLDIANNQHRPILEEGRDVPLAHDQWVWFLGTVFGKITVLSNTLVRYRQHANNTCGAGLSAPGESLLKTLAVSDYSKRALKEQRSGTYLESLASGCPATWRSRSLAGAQFMSLCAQINAVRTRIYKEDAGLLARCKLYSSVLFKGGYSVGHVAAWLGLRAALKDLLVGVFQIRAIRS